MTRSGETPPRRARGNGNRSAPAEAESAPGDLLPDHCDGLLPDIDLRPDALAEIGETDVENRRSSDVEVVAWPCRSVVVASVSTVGPQLKTTRQPQRLRAVSVEVTAEFLYARPRGAERTFDAMTGWHPAATIATLLYDPVRTKGRFVHRSSAFARGVHAAADAVHISRRFSSTQSLSA